MSSSLCWDHPGAEDKIEVAGILALPAIAKVKWPITGKLDGEAAEQLSCFASQQVHEA